MGHGSIVHKIYGGVRLIQACKDWPKWFGEYLTRANDGGAECYRMRSGARLHTRRNGSDFHMIDEIWGFRKYDYFDHRVRPGDVVVDIGGNIGTFTVYAGTVCKASRILVFEPFPENFTMLKRNVEENKLNMVNCVNEAISKTRGRQRFRLDPVDPGSHSLAGEADIGTMIEVQCCPFSDIFERFGIDRIDYLKLDCEGGEYDIFDESTAPLLRRVKQISMEYHDHPTLSYKDIEALLTKNGFQVREFGGHRLYAKRGD